MDVATAVFQLRDRDREDCSTLLYEEINENQRPNRERVHVYLFPAMIKSTEY